MTARKKTKRGPAYQMYADRALGSGQLGRLSWAQQGMFYWLLNRAWIDGGVPHDAKELSRMMPGGPKPAELAPVLALFSAPGEREGEVTHTMHVEQQERLAVISDERRKAAEIRHGKHANAPANAPDLQAETAAKSGANDMPSHALNLSGDITTSPETPTSPPKGAGSGEVNFPPGFPSTVKAARDAAFAVGVAADYAEAVWLEVVGAGFKDRSGKPVVHWSQFIRSAQLRRDEFRAKAPKKTEVKSKREKDFHAM